MGMGGEVKRDIYWSTTEYIENNPKDFLDQARNELEEEIRVNLASKGAS